MKALIFVFLTAGMVFIAGLGLGKSSNQKSGFKSRYSNRQSKFSSGSKFSKSSLSTGKPGTLYSGGAPSPPPPPDEPIPLDEGALFVVIIGSAIGLYQLRKVIVSRKRIKSPVI